MGLPEPSESWASVPWEPMAALLSPLHDRLVSRLSPRLDEHWLDIGSGTGAVALRAARAGARATGVDLAPGMIERARRHAAREGLPVRFEVADAERLPYPTGSFDVVASALGVFLAPNHAAAAAELARVCRPGGRLGIVAWLPDPEFERIHAPSPTPGRPPARREWGRRDYVSALLGDAFELRFEEAELRIEVTSGEHAWRLWSKHDGPMKTRLESLDPLVAARCRRDFVEHFERYRVDGRVSLPRRYLITLGKRVSRITRG